jgi:hypothetical protein
MQEMRPSSLFIVLDMQKMRPFFFLVQDMQQMWPSSLCCAGYTGNAAIFSFYCAVYVGDVAIFSFLCRICRKYGHLLFIFAEYAGNAPIFFIVLDKQEMLPSSLYCAGYAGNAAIFSLLCWICRRCSHLFFLVQDMQEMRPYSLLI